VTTVVCPNGHPSNDREWCDTCGAAIGGSPDGTPAGSSPAAPPAQPPSPSSGGPLTNCPHCGLPNDADNLFCEQCGYDFTTGQAPPQPEVAAPPAQPDSPPDSSVKWVVVVEVDQMWYSLKGSLSDQACPSASSSTIALTQHTALIGRSSQSRGIHPEVALDGDTGVSRRHAQFVRDGDGLAVIDLSSTNGTYVVPVGSDPTEDTAAIDSGVPTPLHDGDRVYVGAWSRLTLRVG
jgi:FHA domain